MSSSTRASAGAGEGEAGAVEDDAFSEDGEEAAPAPEPEPAATEAPQVMCVLSDSKGNAARAPIAPPTPPLSSSTNASSILILNLNLISQVFFLFFLVFVSFSYFSLLSWPWPTGETTRSKLYNIRRLSTFIIILLHFMISEFKLKLIKEHFVFPRPYSHSKQHKCPSNKFSLITRNIRVHFTVCLQHTHHLPSSSAVCTSW